MGKKDSNFRFGILSQIHQELQVNLSHWQSLPHKSITPQAGQEGALTDDGLAVGLEHGPAHHGSAHDDQIREEPARLCVRDQKRQARDK